MSCPSIECCLFVQCRRFLWAQCSSFYFMKFYDMVVPSAIFPSFLPSHHAVSDGAVCLRKFHRLLHNLLIINVDKFLQRGRVLSLFWRQRPQNTRLINLQERLGGRSFCVFCDIYNNKLTNISTYLYSSSM